MPALQGEDIFIFSGVVCRILVVRHVPKVAVRYSGSLMGQLPPLQLKFAHSDCEAKIVDVAASDLDFNTVKDVVCRFA